jgi:hypothetical protein
MLALVLFHVASLWLVSAHSTVRSIISHEAYRELQAVGRVDDLQLINAITNQPIMSLSNGTVINIKEQATSNFNIQAVTSNGIVGSLRFAYNGQPNYRTEKDQPFAFCGDGPWAGNYYVCTALTIGRHTVTATPFSNVGANGTEGTPFQVTFTITNVTSQAPTNSPTKEPTNTPTMPPTQSPVGAPTGDPTEAPSNSPTKEQTNKPTKEPSQAPTMPPTQAPTKDPTMAPTTPPTMLPTQAPINLATKEPTNSPTKKPTNSPTQAPTQVPTNSPMKAPSQAPTSCTIPQVN